MGSGGIKTIGWLLGVGGVFFGVYSLLGSTGGPILKEGGRAPEWASHVPTSGPGATPAETGQTPQMSEVEAIQRPVQSLALSGIDALQAASAELMEHDLMAPMVLGAYLDRKTSLELQNHKGMEHFLLQFSGLTDLRQPVNDLNQFWEQMQGRPMSEREALLRVTDGVARASGDDGLKGRFLREFDDFFQIHESGPTADQNTRYAEQALQLYLSHSKDSPDWEAEMEKRGIPVIRAPASVPETSSTQTEENQ